MIKSLRFGIEIETVGLHRERLAHAICGVVNGTLDQTGSSWRITDSQGRAWQVVPDGSLSDSYHSGEIVSPILGYDDIDLLQNIMRAVRAAGARSDASTGVHVHVDGSLFTPKSIVNLVKLIYKQERLLEHALGVNETRLARYCRPIEATFIQHLEARRPKTMQEVSEAWYGYRNTDPHRYDSSRYHGLNLNSLFFHGSIEFRYFNGTLHAGEVKAYIQLVLALAAKALTAKAASSKRRDFNASTAKYDFRVVLLHLGLIGDEFKTARLHLTKKLSGSAAWKGERRDRSPAPSARSNEEGEEVRIAA
jgi:Putative amidoligase enzyme